MPPKRRAGPRQPARNNQATTTPQHESAEALSVPSTKEALINDDKEAQNTSENLEQVEVPEVQPESFGDVPNSTPSASAATPPPRRSVQRLRSALPRHSLSASSASNAMHGSDNRPSVLKFKPKSFIRRSKEEREAEEKAEAERRAARQTAEGTSYTSDRGAFHSRGRARGQRGGFGDVSRWKNERFNLAHEASGHLGGSTIQDSATTKNRRGGGAGASVPALTSESSPVIGKSRVKKELALKPVKDKDEVIVSSSVSRPNQAKVKKEHQDPNYFSSEGELDSDEGERVNIEDINTINLVSSEDEDEGLFQPSRESKGKRRESTPRVSSSNLMPVRIQRQEHMERAVGVNTDASSLTSAELRSRARNRAEAGGSLFLPEEDETDVSSAARSKVKNKSKDVQFVRNERKWKGVYQDEDDGKDILRVKDEPKDDEDVIMTDALMGMEEAEAIPLDDIDLASRNMQRNANDSGDSLRASFKVPGKPPEDDLLPQRIEKFPRIKGYRGLRQVEISEEEEEDDVFAEIAEIVLTRPEVLLDNSGPELASSLESPGDDPDEALELDGEDTYFQKDGKEEVYLFQLPPVVPSLRDVSKAASKHEDKRKSKTTSAEVPKPSVSNSPFAAQIKDEINIKTDPDELPHEARIPSAYTSDSFPSIGGRGGVLSIHAQGSMLVTWGGMSFQISKEGTGAKLAQELMVTKFERAVTKIEDESRWEEKVDVGKTAWAMGQMHPGHVCIPELLS